MGYLRVVVVLLFASFVLFACGLDEETKVETEETSEGENYEDTEYEDTGFEDTGFEDTGFGDTGFDSGW